MQILSPLKVNIGQMYQRWLYWKRIISFWLIRWKRIPFFPPLNTIHSYAWIAFWEKQLQDLPSGIFSSSLFIINMPAEVVSTTKPKWCDKNRLYFHSTLNYTLFLELIFPYLLNLPVSFTIFPAPWSPMILNYQCNHTSLLQLETWKPDDDFGAFPM